MSAEPVMWEDDCGNVCVLTTDLVDAVREITGARAAMINTGGGCGAVEVELERGFRLLVTDGDVFAAYADEQTVYEGWTVGAYCGEEYDALAFAEAADAPDETPLPTLLAETIERCMSQLVTSLRTV